MTFRHIQFSQRQIHNACPFIGINLFHLQALERIFRLMKMTLKTRNSLIASHKTLADIVNFVLSILCTFHTFYSAPLNLFLNVENLRNVNCIPCYFIAPAIPLPGQIRAQPHPF